jgi:predicted transcriptional regulator
MKKATKGKDSLFVDGNNTYWRDESIGADGYERTGVTWADFNVPLDDVQQPYSSVAHICDHHPEKKLNLQPYMIRKPHVVDPKDEFPKIVQMFRLLNLRWIPVVANGDQAIGMITRGDIFSYMGL